MAQETRAFAVLLASVLGLFLASAVAAADINKIAEGCADCHGKDGVSAESKIPTIAGMSATYVADSMAAFKNKERPCDETKYLSGPNKGKTNDMCKVAKELNDADTKAVAKHFAGKKFVRAKQKFDPALAKKGKEVHEDSCEKCHADGGSDAADDAGFLAGQWTPYLQETFNEYKAGKRPQPEKMKPKVDKLDKKEIEALLHYYASFQ